MSKTVDTSFIPDLPKGGPLAEYRKRANFDWKVLKLIFEEEQILKTKVCRFYNFTEYKNLAKLFPVPSMETFRSRPTFRPIQHNPPDKRSQALGSYADESHGQVESSS